MELLKYWIYYVHLFTESAVTVAVRSLVRSKEYIPTLANSNDDEQAEIVTYLNS